jgi:hypothetical protein
LSFDPDGRKLKAIFSAGTMRRYIRYLDIAIGLSLLLLSSYSVFSQNKKAEKEEETKGQTIFRVPVNVVVLNATVTDKNGNPVKDLTADDFRLYEDGKPQPIQTFALESLGIAARFSETLPVRFDKGKEAEFRRHDLSYSNYFRLRPGKYRLKLAVSDESNNLGSMEQFLEVPALPAQGLALSSLVVAERLSKLPDLIQNLQAQMLDYADPLLYSGTQIQTSADNRIPVNSAIPVLFRIYNLPGRPDQWDLLAKARLLDEKGKEFALEPISLKNSMSAAGKSEAVVSLTLSFQNAPPAKYRLLIEITEPASAERGTLQTDVEFIK